MAYLIRCRSMSILKMLHSKVDICIVMALRNFDLEKFQVVEVLSMLVPQ